LAFFNPGMEYIIPMLVFDFILIVYLCVVLKRYWEVVN